MKICDDDIEDLLDNSELTLASPANGMSTLACSGANGTCLLCGPAQIPTAILH